VNWAFWRREPTEYLRAVHYFGRTQPMSFWDAAAFSEAPGHLAQIRRDGFNTVILVVPWRGFQRTLVPPTYDEFNLSRLRQILLMVQAAGLKFILRVSYPWNSDPDSVGDYDERILGLFTRPEVRKSWLGYLREIRRIGEAFAGFQFAFFSWEDLPSLRELMGHRTDAERLALADATGFRRYLANRFTLPEISRLFERQFASLSEVYIPRPDCEAYRQFNNFVNQSFGDLLAHGRSAWPRLALQIRVDHDQVKLDGKNVWIENDMRLTDFGMRVTYFFPFMYTLCQGETLPAAEVLKNLERMLRRVTDDGRNTRHFLDQFVFHDESPAFPSWSKVRESEMQEYLTGAAQLMKRYSRGFALWNYFDYRANHFYNSAFLRGLQGWTVRGDVSVKPGDEPSCATLAPGAAITQRMAPQMVGNSTALYQAMRFAATIVDARSAGRLRLATNGVTEAEIDIANGTTGPVEVDVPPELHRGGMVEVMIENVGTAPITITDLSLWGFVYRSRIYDEHGKPGPYLEAVRAMLRDPA
jgi:hypothetical protein